MNRQLFLNTLNDFHNKMSTKSFWASNKAQDIAIEALNQDYIRTEHGDYLTQDATSLVATLDEFYRRKFYMTKVEICTDSNI